MTEDELTLEGVFVVNHVKFIGNGKYSSQHDPVHQLLLPPRRRLGLT
jgi:hypothetical protein